MSATLQTFSADGHVVISFAEAAVPPQVKEGFLSAIKAEWATCQSQMTDAKAAALAQDVDAGWWQRNRSRILAKIGEA